jgi:hypothetical protein
MKSELRMLLRNINTNIFIPLKRLQMEELHELWESKKFEVSFHTFTDGAVSSSLGSAGRLIVLIRRHGIELRAARTKARKGRESAGSRVTQWILCGCGGCAL